MTESKVIENTEYPITKEKIVYDLVHGGIRETDTLLVHSSLSSMGYVIGKEMTVVDALLEVTMNGCLVMPSQTGDNSDPALWVNPPVSESWIEIIKEHTPSYNKHTFSTRGMGKIVECFRHYPKVQRSDHPQCSFIAKGKNARYITKKHKLTPAFGMSSPLGKLYTLQGKVLLLGVSYDAATIFHLAEVLSNTLSFENQGAKLNEKWISYQDYSYDASDFILLGKALEREKLVSLFKVGQADCILFEIQDAVDFAKEWFIHHRDQNIRIEEEVEDKL